MSEETKFSDFFQKLFAAGWGVVTFSEEKAKNFIDEMIRRGEISQAEGEGLMKDMMDKIQTGGRETEQRIRETINKYMKASHVSKRETDEEIPLKAQIEELKIRIAALEKKLADKERGQESEEQS